MTRLHFARLTLVILFVVSTTTLLSAQAGEVYVFGGGFWPGNKVFNDEFLGLPNVNIVSDDAKMAGGGTYGVKVGGFLGANFTLDGNLSWYNHFAVGRPSDILTDNNLLITPLAALEGPEVRSLLWEGSGTWLFAEQGGFSPYLTFGLGGMTARIKNADAVFVTGGGFIENPAYINAASPVPRFIPNPARRVVMDNNDTFLTFSYGGGFQAMNLWGPAGFRVDFRGRTIPNFYSRSLTRPELTAGLTFGWGER